MDERLWLDDREIRAAHAGLSPSGDAFLRFVADHPECLERSSFTALERSSALSPFPLQPWPVLVDGDCLAEMERLSVALCRLIKSLPERLFDRDAQRIASYYDLDSADLAQAMLTEPDGIAGALGRGDFIRTRAGFQCVEFNFASHLGGWQAARWAEDYLRVPVLERFVDSAGIEVSCRNTLRHLFSHAVSEAREKRLSSDGEVHLAVVVPEDLEPSLGRELESYLRDEYGRVTARGTVSLYSYSELRERGGCLYAAEKRIHVVIEAHDSATSAPAWRAFKAGRLNLYNAPARAVLSDKRNLALLSELASGGAFDPPERQLIERHVPWTRHLAAVETTWRAEAVRLPELALTRRAELVLKDARFATSGQGRGVHVGAFTAAERWRELIEEAVRDGGWVLQERVESLPFLHQRGERGSAPHEAVWGLFVFGESYAGGFLTLVPKGESGVINVARGASAGIILEVSSSAESAAAAPDEPPEGIAVIGMAGRFPGAGNVEEFWRNLAGGEESIRFFSPDEVRAAGVEEALIENPDYVRARALIDAPEHFDAALFGYNPREAEIMDPQHRLLMECAWQALEHAGYDAERYDAPIGLFAGAGTNAYLLFNLYGNPELLRSVGSYQAMLGSTGDFLTTSISYKLNLKGSSLTVQTACSTSLVAVHLAAQSLANGECDLALAGGVRISVPQKAGHLYQAEGIYSPDGHCRPFDAAGAGTVEGDGVGMVVLKRLDEALADGDHVHAVILGSAVNNDGAAKIGYTAPSVEGQAEVVAMAQAVAGVEPESISYVEAHGTATPLGDPIEVEALEQAFATERRGFCALGAVKGNIGHLDAAAGIAGFIKAALSLEHGEIPPTLHFEQPNPRIDFSAGPFYVPARPVAWSPGPEPRRAGVSAFGIGGTNAHVVLEEAPATAAGDPSRPHQLLVLSAASETALEAITGNLVAHLEDHPELDLADVAFTLQVGRRVLPHRRMVVGSGLEDIRETLARLDPKRVLTRHQEPENRPVTFLFSGQGAQYPGMSEELYRTESTFRDDVDRCAEFLHEDLGLDLRSVLYPAGAASASAAEQLKRTAFAQPALFVVEYALARLWMSWGVRPTALAGHSIGEYVAACLAGVWTLEEALTLVAARGRLIQDLPGGVMLAVPLGEAELVPLLGDRLGLAAVNGPVLCVVSGPAPEVAELESLLASRGVEGRRLHTSHAFHSPMMDPALDAFSEVLAGVSLAPPELPFVSDSSGDWIGAEEATDPDYWRRHLRDTVRFSAVLERLFEKDGAVLLEVGPGHSLSSLARRHPGRAGGQIVLSSLPTSGAAGTDASFLLRTLGQLWLAGAEVDWTAFHGGARRRRVALPTYPFEGRRYWIERSESGNAARPVAAASGRRERADWFYVPLWRQTLPPGDAATVDGGWLVFTDAAGFGARWVERLRESGCPTVVVRAGEGFRRTGEDAFEVRPGAGEDYDALLEELARSGALAGIRRVVHLWTIAPLKDPARISERGFYSLLALVQALGRRSVTGEIRLDIVSTGLFRLTDEELCPAKATLLGPALVIPQEHPDLDCRVIDLTLPEPGSRRESRVIDQLLAEIASDSVEPVVAYRGSGRWRRAFEPSRLDAGTGDSPLRPRGTYLVTGGLGGVGLEIAEFLAQTVEARLILLSRSPLPAREEWSGPAAHDDATARKVRRVLALEQLGAEVLTVAADVTEATSMRRALDAGRERFGALHGVIHAAGVAGGGVMQSRTREEAAAVLAPKVEGTLTLEQVLLETLAADEELDFFILCSSLNAILGGPGQADYVAANAFLDSFAQARAAELPVMSINWDTWRGIGMAALADAARNGRAPAGEPAEVGEMRPFAHPLLTHRSSINGKEVFISRLRSTDTWVLEEHRLGGYPIVPGTAYLEMAGVAVREAVSGTAAGTAIEMRDILFIAPLKVEDGETREVRTVLRRQGEAFELSVSSRSPADQWHDHVVGTVRTLPAAEPARHDVAAILAGGEPEVLGEEYRERLREAGLGPRWKSLKKVWVGREGVLGWLELAPQFSADTDEFLIHPALLDAATSFAEAYTPGRDGYYLPMSYRRLQLHGPLPPRFFSYARWRGGGSPSGETISFDVTIFDPEGSELVEVEEFTLKRVGDVARMVQRQVEDRTPTAPGGSRGRDRAVREPAGEPQEGMAAAEATEALRRILARNRSPQIAVSAVDLREEIVRARAFSPVSHLQAESADRHPRPDLATPFVAPRTELEGRLAEIWQDILGVDQVGVGDSFFELGGHSLLGTQLVSRVRQEFGVEVPLGKVFEAETVGDFAALIEGWEVSPAASADEMLPRPAGAKAELSFAQERIWFLDRLEPGNAFYHISQAVRLEGSLDVARLGRSLGRIVRRHEVLRTAFPGGRDRPRPRVLPRLRLSLPLVDLESLPEARREREAERLATALTEHRFDLEHPPLFAVRLLRLASERHVFVLTLHHIISDGWSVAVFISELAELYRAFSAGQPPTLPELGVQYADFAHWQRGTLGQERVETELAYWRRQLAGPLPVLDLPTDRPRPSVRSFRGASELVTLSEDLTGAVKTLAQGSGSTPFMALVATFALLLERYSRQDDLLVGTPVAGRNRREVEELIGMFLNTLVLRFDLAGAPAFQELLARVRQVTLDAYAHQEVPVEQLIEELQPERDLSRTSLFQVLFNMQDFPSRDFTLPGLTITSLPLRQVPSKFDLTVYAAEVERRIVFELVYNADIFDRATATAMLQQFRALLEQAVAQPATSVDKYTLLTPAARAQVADAATILDQPVLPTPGRLFLSCAAKVPERPAVGCGELWLTYGELRGRALDVAVRLRASGLEPGEVAALAVPRGPELIAGLLGVMLAGGVFLILDRRLPGERLRLMLREARARYLLRAAGWSGELPSLPTVELSAWSDKAPSPPDHGDGPDPAPDDPAYVFFTSGSTGVPKGVLGRQKGLSHFVTWQRERFGIGEGDRVAQLIALTFDGMLRDVFLALTSGALSFLPEDEDLSPARVLPWLERSGVTVLHTVPSLAAAWLASPLPEARPRCLRWLFFTGEPLSGELVRQWRARFPETGGVVNLYGPTETTLTKCFYVVPEEPRRGVQPIGRALPQTQVLVWAAGGRPCGVGEPGEIVLRTPFRSLGYLNLPEETRRRFRKNPLRDDDDDLLYFTGDLGRFRPGGTLEFLGRLDHQVKIRGMRVEPAEVEAVLGRHEAVRECVVVGRKESAEPARLVAFLVPRSSGTEGVELELRRDLERQLPDYMVPSVFVTLDALPLTPSGKLDRAALGRRPLPAPRSDVEGGEAGAAPRTATEKTLAALWCDLLDLEQVGIHSNFFELGGHSLLAIQLVSRVRETCGVELPVRDLFEAPTVALLATRLEAVEVRQGGAPPLAPEPREGPLPLSFTQHRLWFLDQLTPGSTAYNIPVALRLKGGLEIAVLAASLTEIVRRHEVVRTRFVSHHGEPLQVIDAPSSMELPVVDLAGVGAAQRLSEAQCLAAVDRPFDLAHDPLLRSAVLRLADEDHVVLLTMHHIVSDGWSMGILMRELGELYRAFSQGRRSPLPELAVQYADFARWQRQWLRREALEEELAYWRQRLGGTLPALNLPADRPRPALQTFRGADRSRVLGTQLATELKDLSQRAEATLFMTLLAAFQVLLRRLSGQMDILVGTPVAGRDRAEVEGLIGPFINTLVLRTDLSGAPKFREVLSRAREGALEAYGHQRVPFEEVLQDLQPDRDPSRTPVFQVLFNMLNFPQEKLWLTDLSAEYLTVPLMGSKFDLTLYAAERGGEIDLRLLYNADLFDGTRIDEILGQYEILLRQIVERPGEEIERYSLLTPAARRLLPDPAAELLEPDFEPLGQMFLEQAARLPDRPAVTAEGSIRSYGALRIHALGIARLLLDHGTGPGTVVAVCGARSPQLIGSLLGVFLAGGVLLTLDRRLPARRLQTLLQEAQAGKLLYVGERHPGDAWMFDETGPDVITVPPALPESPVAPPELPKPAPDEAAYIFFTSGTTGVPKGVLGCHKGLSHFLDWQRRSFDIHPGDRAAQLTGLGFDVVLRDVFLPLVSGAALCLPDGDDLSAEAVFPWFERNAVTVIHTVPSLAGTWLRSPQTSSGTLRWLFFAGEPLVDEVARRSREVFSPSGGIVNLYGPTETTLAKCFYRVPDPPAPGVEPVGEALPQTQALVLGQGGGMCGIGEPGEIVIRTPFRSLGYLSSADESGSFRDNPFRKGSGDLVYFTGDRGRYRPDGLLEILGRLDDQVKIRGMRVEPAEIRALIARQDEVAECEVLARRDAGEDCRLVAYVVPRSGDEMDVGALRKRLREMLPAYMMPFAFVLLDGLPLTSNGKVDRRALPAPDASRPALEHEYVAPGTPSEEELAKIVIELLGIKKVGVHDSFFDLGGHSLLATRYRSRICRLFEIDLPLQAIFETPDVASLAVTVEESILAELQEENDPWTGEGREEM